MLPRRCGEGEIARDADGVQSAVVVATVSRSRTQGSIQLRMKASRATGTAMRNTVSSELAYEWRIGVRTAGGNVFKILGVKFDGVRPFGNVRPCRTVFSF